MSKLFCVYNSKNSKCHVRQIIFTLVIVSISRSYASPHENNLGKLQNHQITTKTSIQRQLSSNFKIGQTENNILKLAESGLGLENKVKRLFQNATYLDRGIRYSNMYEELKEAEVYCESFNLTDNGRAKWNELNSTLEYYAEVNDDVSLEEMRRQDASQLTRPEQYSYSVLLVLKKQDSKRIGVFTEFLLTAEWVITAVHCLIPVKGINVTFIEIYVEGYSFKEFIDDKFVNGSQRSESTELYTNPHYKDVQDFDVGLVKANEIFNLSNTVDTVSISTVPWSYQRYYTCVITCSRVIQVAETNPEDLKQKTHFLMVKQPCLCKCIFGSLLGTKKVSRYICPKSLEGYGICPGDSEGGMVCDGMVCLAMQMIAVTRLKTRQVEVFISPMCDSKNTFSICEDTCPL